MNTNCQMCGKDFSTLKLNYKITPSVNKTKKYCSNECRHNARRKYFDSTVIDRFWKNVQKSDNPNECWTWTGSPAGSISKGYGCFRYQGKTQKAHRVMWQLTNGPFIDESLFVLHKCSNDKCVNPNHLKLGTHQDNMADRKAAGREAWGDKNGSRKYPERLKRGDNHPLRLHPELITTKGEGNAAALLTEAQVLEIRDLYAKNKKDHFTKGNISIRSLAEQFNMSNYAIWSIIKRKSWKHI